MKESSNAFEDEFLTTKQIAEALGKNLSTVQRWYRKGEIPAARIGNSYIVRRRDFDEWFESRLTTHNQGDLSG
jgi:excisionase family DNA binding protein